MTSPLTAASAVQTQDLVSSVFGDNGLSSSFKRLLKQGETGNGRRFVTSSGHGPEGRSFTVSAQPPLQVALKNLFQNLAWTDPSAPVFSVAVPPDGGALTVQITGLNNDDVNVSYLCLTPTQTNAALRSIDEQFYDWVLETSHQPTSPAPSRQGLQVRTHG